MANKGKLSISNKYFLGDIAIKEGVEQEVVAIVYDYKEKRFLYGLTDGTYSLKEQDGFVNYIKWLTVDPNYVIISQSSTVHAKVKVVWYTEDTLAIVRTGIGSALEEELRIIREQIWPSEDI